MTRIAQSIEVNVPVSTAYNQWTQFEEFPRFMQDVREVRQLDAAHLHWRVNRNGMEMEWDSEITEQVPDHHIAWRDTSGPKNAGCITFQPMQPDKTRVYMTIDCDPTDASAEAGQAAQAISQRVEEDLARFKKLLESQGRESGAWRDEIHDSRTVRANMAPESDATDNPMQKPVGQTESERLDAAQSSADQHRTGGVSPASGARQGSGNGTDNDSEPGRAQQQSTGKGAANVGRGSGSSSKPGRPQWLPNMLQGWEDPRVMVKKMSEEMDQLFERFIGRPMSSRSGQGGSSGKWMPPVEVVQRDNQLIICADLPGIKREDVQIEINQDKLTIEGERRDDRQQAELQGYRRSERSYGHFYRMIPLPSGVDPDSAQASMHDGVLEITIPVPASAQRRGRRIEIQPPH
jgi:HSP20 family molecular chaperone IbpA